LRVRKVALPVFEGLLPEPHDRIVQDLIYQLASVHTLAKLRIHTAATLMSLDDTVTHFGEQLRKFEDVTCTAHETKELPREVEKRVRREARRQAIICAGPRDKAT